LLFIGDRFPDYALKTDLWHPDRIKMNLLNRATVIDLHNHTVASDGRLALQELVGLAADAHLDGIGITDHNVLRRTTDTKIGRLFVFGGIEVTTAYGELLVFGVDNDRLPTDNPLALVRAVNDVGGVVIAPHPYSPKGICTNLSEKQIDSIVPLLDAIEVLNGQMEDYRNNKALELAQRFGKPCVGGSDCNDKGSALRAATRFGKPIKSLTDMMSEIREGSCEPIELS